MQIAYDRICIFPLGTIVSLENMDLNISYFYKSDSAKVLAAAEHKTQDFPTNSIDFSDVGNYTQFKVFLI